MAYCLHDAPALNKSRGAYQQPSRAPCGVPSVLLVEVVQVEVVSIPYLYKYFVIFCATLHSQPGFLRRAVLATTSATIATSLLNRRPPVSFQAAAKLHVRRCSRTSLSRACQKAGLDLLGACTVATIRVGSCGRPGAVGFWQICLS